MAASVKSSHDLAFEDHPFWDFSLKVYSSEGVGAACLALQERRGVDVNLVLFCIWNGASGRGRLSAGELDAALAAVRAWNRDIVVGLRAVRDELKGGMAPIPKDRSDALRKRILKIEIDCEHAEQLALANAVGRVAQADLPPDRRAEDAAANVAAYFRRHGFAPDAQDTTHTTRILNAAFPEVGAVELEEMCRKAVAG
jgi:uncharacterized protein (TIGR02444 family)